LALLAVSIGAAVRTRNAETVGGVGHVRCRR
jgi:hypothetical protein